MLAKCQTIVEYLEKFAPKRLAERWDNVGLQIGHPAAEIHRIMVALDATPEVLKEAVERKVDMLVTHHPFFFDEIKHIRFDQPFGNMIKTAINSGINIYSAHTNLDIAFGGVNDYLANTLELSDIEPLMETSHEVYYKIVVFVPKGHEDAVRDAMAMAGAGWIGNYSHCTFQTQGTGTFKPLERAQPYIGNVGKVEKTDEFRLETIIPESLKRKVLSAMLKAHPYEEVAFDIYPLANEPKKFGIGRIGQLQTKTTLNQLCHQLKGLLSLQKVKYVGDLNTAIQKVAVCGGSGMSTLKKAHFKGADVLITGDVKYHDAQNAINLGVAVIDAGHFETEVPIVKVITDYIEKFLIDNKYQTEIIVSKKETPPLNFI